LDVTRGGYYRHLNKAVDYYHLELIEAVQELAKASDHTYGSRRMVVALGVMSYPVSRNKAKKLMKEAGVLVKRRKKFKVTTDSNHAKPLFDNILNRDFAPKGVIRLMYRTLRASVLKKAGFIWLRLSTYIHGVLLAGAWAQE
jgi:transposase InsO family protein